MTPERRWKKMWLFNLVSLFLVVGALVPLVLFHLVELTFLITFVVLLVASGLLMYFRQKSNVQRRPDERLWRIGYRASWFAWNITIYGMAAFGILDYFHLISLDTFSILTILAVGSCVSFIIIFWIMRAVGEASE
jgi:uncharacterized membrane protein